MACSCGDVVHSGRWALRDRWPAPAAQGVSERRGGAGAARQTQEAGAQLFVNILTEAHGFLVYSQVFWNGDVSTECSGRSRNRMFFSNLAASYLQRVPSSCLPGCREPQDSKKNAAQMFPLSALLWEAAPRVFSSLSWAGKSL